MKKDLHPKYHENSTITCACGNVITAGSTANSIEIEICSSCHPFYTGKEKLVDAAGRIEKFRQKMQKKETLAKSKKPKAPRKKKGDK